MEINDLRELALDPNRPKQNRRRLIFSPLATDLLSQIVKERARRSATMKHNTILNWDSKLSISGEHTRLACGRRRHRRWHFILVRLARCQPLHARALLACALSRQKCLNVMALSLSLPWSPPMSCPGYFQKTCKNLTAAQNRASVERDGLNPSWIEMKWKDQPN